MELGNIVPTANTLNEILEKNRKIVAELSSAYGELKSVTTTFKFDEDGNIVGTTNQINALNSELKETVDFVLDIGKIGNAKLFGGSQTVQDKVESGDIKVSGVSASRKDIVSEDEQAAKDSNERIEEMKEFGQEETEAGEEIEDAGEEIEGAGEEMEEEGQKLESFKSFISKRKA